MLNAVMLNAIMLSVVAPKEGMVQNFFSPKAPTFFAKCLKTKALSRTPLSRMTCEECHTMVG
jgi:hypothetical protein